MILFYIAWSKSTNWAAILSPRRDQVDTPGYRMVIKALTRSFTCSRSMAIISNLLLLSTSKVTCEEDFDSFDWAYRFCSFLVEGLVCISDLIKIWHNNYPLQLCESFFVTALLHKRVIFTSFHVACSRDECRPQGLQCSKFIHHSFCFGGKRKHIVQQVVIFS